MTIATITKVSSPSHRRRQTRPTIAIERFSDNPLIVPDPRSSWMSAATFNCGVIKDGDGPFPYRMLFRAASRQDHLCSSFGVAFSNDGKKWFIHDEPVLLSGFNQHCIQGIDDPRIVLWNGWYYIFTTVLGEDSTDSPVVRVGIFRTRDFFCYEWVGIPFDQIDKNAAVFPEPIGGNALLLHRRFPDLWISKTKDMSLRSGWNSSQVLVRANELYPSLETGAMPRKIGMAAPPIKTPMGWLVLVFVTHREGALSEKFDGTYSLGFVVLDLYDPTRVKYVHYEPILWPTKDYETVGCVPNVVFCCAAVDTGGEDIFVFWGAADTSVAGGSLRKESLQGICY